MNWPSQTRPCGQRPSLAAEPMWPCEPTSTRHDPQAVAKACARSNETRSSLRLARTMEGKGRGRSSIGAKPRPGLPGSFSNRIVYVCKLAGAALRMKDCLQFRSASTLAMLRIREGNTEFLCIGFKKALGGVGRTIGQNCELDLEVHRIACFSERDRVMEVACPHAAFTDAS